MKDEERLVALKLIESNKNINSFRIAEILGYGVEKAEEILRDLEDRNMVEWHHITLDGSIQSLRIKSDGRDFLEKNSSRWKKLHKLLPENVQINLVKIG